MKNYLIHFMLLILVSYSAVLLARESLGNESAMVTMTMYGDYQCPFTQRGMKNINDLMKDQSIDIRFQFKNFPLSFHPEAEHAARAAFCSGEQGKFWEFHQALMTTKTDTFSIVKFEEIANAQKIDMKKYRECFKSDRSLEAIKTDVAEANKLKIMGTPYIVIDGPRGKKVLNGAYPIEDMKRAIDETL